LYVVETAVDPTQAGLVGERGPVDKQAFVVAFFRQESAPQSASSRRQRRSADPGGATSSNDQRQARRRRRYRTNDRPATAWSYHGRFHQFRRLRWMLLMLQHYTNEETRKVFSILVVIFLVGTKAATLVAALLRVARVTAGLAGGKQCSLPPGL